MRKLFGTDGIRGVAGEYPLDKKTVWAIGRALGHHLAPQGAQPVVVLGRDTRESSEWIARMIAAGLSSSNCFVLDAGVITTPGVAYVAKTKGLHAGVVISASHNPWQDNGIKIFGGDGYKLADKIELEIEEEIFSLLNSGDVPDVPQPATLVEDPGLKRLYIGYLLGSVQEKRIGRMKLIVDCANGAASALAQEVFNMMRLNADFTHSSPNGRNINENCGALHPEVVGREVVAKGADMGICFDGDADRALFTDAHGKVVNGDAVMLLCARAMKESGVLKGDSVVASTMSNMGLEAALKRSGIAMKRAGVGDKYVLEMMMQTGANLGGEQSGHIIFSDLATTGDGLLTALRVLDTVAHSGKPLHELVADLKVFPQVIKNVKVREKQPLNEIAEVANAIAAAERELDGNGRVVVRYSGTEKLARVMIEAESEELMKRHADAIAGAIQAKLGV